MSSENGGGADNVVTLGDNSEPKDQSAVVTDNNSGGDKGKAGGEWLAALSEENRAYAEKKGWKDLNAQVGSYRELESAFGKKSGQQKDQQPAAKGGEGDAPVIPTTAAEYEFKLPGEFPKEGFYDKTFAETFKGWAHKAKLSTAQAQALHDMYVTNMAGLVQTGQEKSQSDFNTSVQNAFNDLTKEWGKPDTDGFKRQMEMSRRAIANLDPGLKDALKASGIIAVDAKGQEVVTNATVFKALAKAGGRMFAEDAIFGAPAATENPFDPKKPNLAKQGELLGQNPELAKSLIEAAGATEWNWWIQKHFPKK